VSPRVRKILIGVAVVVVALVVLAAVSSRVQPELVSVKTGEVVVCTSGEVVEDNTKELQVPPSEVAEYSVTMRTITCPDHQDLAKLYGEAQKAIADGDLTTASEKLQQVVAVNLTYKKASEQLEQIAAGKTPKADTDTGTTDNAPSTTKPDESTDPVSNLTKYVPDKIAGYSAQGVTADPASITRNYLPTSGKADLLVISAEQAVDKKSAANMIATLKTNYPSSAAKVSIGSKTGYFGVRDSAAVVLVADRAIVVTFTMHAKQGGGAALKSALLKVARAVLGG